MNLYKITYGEYSVRGAYIVAKTFGDAERVFTERLGLEIGNIEFVSGTVYAQETADAGKEKRDEG